MSRLRTNQEGAQQSPELRLTHGVRREAPANSCSLRATARRRRQAFGLKMKAFGLVICFGGMAAGCLLNTLDRERVDYGRAQVEPRIDAKAWDETNLVTQILAWVVTNDVDITGEWIKCAHDDGVCLRLKKQNAGRYAVVFDADGDLARWTLMRTGTLDSGILALDRPVQGYVPVQPFRFFYLVRTPIGDRLISQPDVRFWLLEKKLMQMPEWQWKMMKDYALGADIFMRKR